MRKYIPAVIGLLVILSVFITTIHQFKVALERLPIVATQALR